MPCMEREKKITLLFMALEVQIMPGASKLHKKCAFLSKCSPVNSFKIIITPNNFSYSLLT